MRYTGRNTKVVEELAGSRFLVDREWADMVRAEVAEAERRCREYLRSIRPRYVTDAHVVKSDKSYDVSKKINGVCGGCGCWWDDSTDWCTTCKARHSMRRLHRERKRTEVGSDE